MITNEEAIEYYDNMIKSSGHQKLLNYFREIIDTTYFQRYIINARKEYKIPKDGFKVDSDNYSTIPDEWEYKDDEKIRKKISKEIRSLCKKYYLHYLDGTELIEGLLFYNFKDKSFYPDSYNMCLITDLADERKEPFAEETQKNDDLLYPIAIRISPYASLRDILDYVKRAYKIKIVPMQKSYQVEGVKIGKFKKRKDVIIERNKFIYENRHLPRKEIMSLVNDKFGEQHSVDYGYIGKIISLEDKKRKEL